jgi:hypothetical protein
MEDRIRGLEKIKRAKGELSIIILRNNQEFIVNNGSETIFNIECEDYLLYSQVKVCLLVEFMKTIFM